VRVVPSHQERAWIEAARDQVDRRLLEDLVVGMVDIPSPTGEEGRLARWLAGQLEAFDLDGGYQPIDDMQGNATGRLRGDGSGADLLLYAPIDTLTVGTEQEDLPWAGDSLRPDLQAAATVDGEYVLGLGASNPKAHGACVVAAVAAVRSAGVPVSGDVLVGLGAGGMPTNRRPVEGARYNAGQGSGCSFLLEQGFWADYAVIAKPGWAVHWEEVGLCWFEVRTHGTYSYVGSRHRMPYRNAIVDAGLLVQHLEQWFPKYTAKYTSGLVAPQGNIGAVEGGWLRTPSLSPATCRVLVDLRTGPDQDPMSVKREFGAAVAAFVATTPDVEVTWEMVLAIPGTRTEQDSWIVRAAIASWEDAEGRPHVPILENSGATDANILRSRGIPTARIGMSRIGPDAPVPPDFASGMNCVSLIEMERLTRMLIHTIVTTCTRPRAALEAQA
jgi:acetylornithine deacetylase/succinyl-diaminopimelate desuccinylase-like protein